MSDAKTAAPYGIELNLEAYSVFWDNESPQPAIVSLAENEKIIGDVLDLGCGTGENALMLMARGHMVWGIDSSADAIERARKKSDVRQMSGTFVLGSALDLEVLGEGFHTVIDTGLFHIFSDQERQTYLRGLHHVMFPGSCLYLLCFSDREPGDWGPRRVKRSELRQTFSQPNGFRVKSIVEARFHLSERPEGVRAWLATIERIDKE